MADFEKKEWTDRITEYPNRRILTDVSTGESQTVYVERSEGNVSAEGDAFSEENMNGLEERIKTAFATVPSSTTISKIEVVSALPADAAKNPTTLYLIRE